MQPRQIPPEPERPVSAAAASPTAAAAQAIQPSSPRFFFSAAAAVGSHRRIAIAVDLSDESAYAVQWAVQHYLRQGDAVVLLHVRPTSVLYGADWGAVDLHPPPPSAADDPEFGNEPQEKQLDDDFDAFTAAKAEALARPLVDAGIPFKLHIVKDHDIKERLCLEVERLGLSAVIMGSRRLGPGRRSSKSRLGSVSDYCVHHCVCPVVVVRFPDEGDASGSGKSSDGVAVAEKVTELDPVPEEDQGCRDASNEHKG